MSGVASANSSATGSERPTGGKETIREARPPAGKSLREGLIALVSYPRMVVAQREILSNFYQRELRARFRGTVLGFVWPFVLPLVLFLVYYFVFAELLGAKFGRAGLADAAQKQLFTVYLFVGVVVWSGFAESVTRNASVILENSNLIKKISFPSEILPLNTVLASVTIQALALIAYLIVAPQLGWNPWGWRMLALPVLFAVQVAFSLGLSLGFSAMNVFVRDTQPLLGIAMTFWQFLTPVFWARDQVPGIEKYSYVLTWNPMHHLLEGYRKVLVNPGTPQYRDLDAKAGFPDFEWPWAECANVAAASVVVFVLGYSLFLASKRKFADEL